MHKHAHGEKKNVHVPSCANTFSFPLTHASTHAHADCFIISKCRFLKRPNQCSNAVFGTTNESGAQPWCLVWIDKIRISFFFLFFFPVWSVMVLCAKYFPIEPVSLPCRALCQLRWGGREGRGARGGAGTRNEYCGGSEEAVGGGRGMGVWMGYWCRK